MVIFSPSLFRSFLFEGTTFRVYKNREFYGTEVFSGKLRSLLECVSICNTNVSCAAVTYRTNGKWCVGLADSGVMYGKAEIEVVTAMKEDGWLIVFIGKQGCGAKVFDLWNGTSFTNPDVKYNDTICQCHYKSELVEDWDNIGIGKVILSLHQSDNGLSMSTRGEAHIIFKGQDTNKTSWFSSSNVLSSSWTDLRSQPHSYFSMMGSFDISVNIARRFYINSLNMQCDSDLGWLIVVDNEPGLCSYENQPIPTFWFAGGSTLTKWIGGAAQKADYMKIMIQLNSK
ncbi:uncharacterized protein LOC135499701 [Lineus longissimus]|uniref:uncharacterized protein LOC135499701 n=1 Tax=Lineus longissimus TaxID=88925 RepID=UPI00315CA959